MRRRYRLAVWITHPIQYHAPLFRKLAEHPQINLTAYYGSEHGSVYRVDPEFGVSFRWDVALLEGYRYEFLRNYSLNRTPTGFWWVVNPSVIMRLFRRKYDAVVIHGYASATSCLAYLGAWLTHTPVLFRGETALRDQSRWRQVMKGMGLRFLFRHTAGCLAIGQKSAEFYRAYDVPQSRIFLTPYCVDNEFFTCQGNGWRLKREETRQELCLANDLPTLLFAGKLIPRKRPMDLIEAVTRLSMPVAVLFVGDGPLRPALESEALRRGLTQVRFVGFQNQTVLPRYYAAADIFVFPSAYEPYGLAVNEAMCVGLPILTTPAVAASADLVREGENGFLFAVGDVKTLARRIRQLVTDRELCQAMGQRSREIIADWNYDACVKGVVSALECVARGTR